MFLQCSWIFLFYMIFYIFFKHFFFGGGIILSRSQELESDTHKIKELVLGVLVTDSTALKGTHPLYFGKSAVGLSVLAHCIMMYLTPRWENTELIFLFVLQVYKCIQKNCELSFPDQDSFLEHIHTHNEDQDLQYRCHFCSKVFNALDKLSHHQHEQHSTYPQAKKTVGPR